MVSDELEESSESEEESESDESELQLFSFFSSLSEESDELSEESELLFSSLSEELESDELSESSSSFFSSCFSAAAAAFMALTFSITSLMSIRANRISGFSVTLFPFGYRPKVFMFSSDLFSVFN